MADCMIFPDTLDEFLEKYQFKDEEEVYTNGSMLIPVFRVKQWAGHIPAVDAVEVVRCRECKNWETDWMPDMFFPDPPRHYCAINDSFLTGDWFCAAGERIEDGNNK